MNPVPSKRVRCAIYTRKSSEEGLEQDFNSLDAQREACAAYVLSQASEGWQLLPEHYDDGGISGGTLARPALQRLLDDVAAGEIDIIVVYKVDRLTRSLLDFSKLVEAFDAAGVSFVSVTQSFNTTTSMGRLTLNMLLSFAQFEREVTAERIRDKIAASKAKGMWMGGTPPLGYAPNGRSLAIVEEHAAIIRDIHARYLELGTVRRLAEQLEARGVRTPARMSLNGKPLGGAVFSRGQLHSILSNPIYVGEIPHKGKRYQGLHAPIIEREVWDKVQARLAEQTQGKTRIRSPHAALLAGLILDAGGEPMVSVHASKGTVRYRYYVSRSLQHGTGRQASGMRLPAREIENLVRSEVSSLFDDPLLLASRLSLDISPAVLRQMTDACEALSAGLRAGGGVLRDIVAGVRALPDTLEIVIDAARLATLLGSPAPPSLPPLKLSAAYRLTRTGRAMRLVQDNGLPAGRREPDIALVKLIVQARKWWAVLAEGRIDITALAEQEGVNDSYITRVVRAAFLSPEVTEAILAGRQHGSLDSRQLRGTGGIPACWREQRARFLPSECG